MNILSANNTSDLYGASRSQALVLMRLAQEGHNITAILPETGPLHQMLEASGISVLLHPRLSIVERKALRSAADKLRLLLNLPLSVIWLAWIIVRRRINLVHTNTAVMISPPLAALLTRRPHLWHVREVFDDFPSAWRYFQTFISALSTIVIAVSEAVRQQFKPSLRTNVQVLYCGLPASDFSQPKDVYLQEWQTQFGPANGPVAVVVGRIKWLRKGQEVLVRAAHILKEKYPTARYFIVGSPFPGNEEHETKLRELISVLGVSSQFIFTGDLSDTRPAYAAADVSVVPSVQAEPFGRVAMESMGMGTPVIASRVGGLAEQVVDNETGILFQPGNAEDLASALDRIFASSELREQMALAGKQRFCDVFEFEASYQKFITLLESAVGKRLDGEKTLQIV